MKNKIAYKLNNFFRMLIKDPGAHFTYNLGVGTMRVALLLFIIAAAVTVAYFTIDGVKLIYIGEVKAAVTDVEEQLCFIDPKTGELLTAEQFMKVPEYREMTEFEQNKYSTYRHFVTFEGNMPDGTPFELTQKTNWALFSNTYLTRLRQPRSRYKLFRVANSDELYVTVRNKSTYQALTEYCGCNNASASPVPLWGIFLPLTASIVLFLIGRREINLAMKYPRSDVPEELSGAPAVASGSEHPSAYEENPQTNETSADALDALPYKGETQ